MVEESVEVDNELIDIMWSSNERKVLDALSTIDNRISAELLAVVLGVAKVYANLKIRQKALEVLK